MLCKLVHGVLLVLAFFFPGNGGFFFSFLVIKIIIRKYLILAHDP